MRIKLDQWRARSVPPVCVQDTDSRNAFPVTPVNTLMKYFIVLCVHWEPTPRIQLQQPARLVLLDHSLVPLDHHRVRFVLWGHTLVMFKQGTTQHKQQHRA